MAHTHTFGWISCDRHAYFTLTSNIVPASSMTTAPTTVFRVTLCRRCYVLLFEHPMYMRHKFSHSPEHSPIIGGKWSFGVCSWCWKCATATHTQMSASNEYRVMSCEIDFFFTKIALCAGVSCILMFAVFFCYISCCRELSGASHFFRLLFAWWLI